jgi:hypothetical protein
MIYDDHTAPIPRTDMMTAQTRIMSKHRSTSVDKTLEGVPEINAAADSMADER